MDLASMTPEERTTALSSMSSDDLATTFSALREEATTLFSIEEAAATVETADRADALVAAIEAVETEQTARTTAAAERSARFAAARDRFSATAVEEAPVEEAADEEATEEDEEATDVEEVPAEEPVVETPTSTNTDTSSNEGEEAEAPTEEETVTASAGAEGTTRMSGADAARAVAARSSRQSAARAAATQQPVVITASADMQGFSAGAEMNGMADVTRGILNRAKSFPKFNEKAAKALNRSNGGQMDLKMAPVASFGMNFDAALTASSGSSISANADYAAVKAAMAQRNSPEALTAGGWCAPSEIVYSWISDYEVFGMISVPEVSAPRGGIMLTTGPVKQSSQGAALDDFGFSQTEAQAIARQEKTCEVITCPEFTDHRLEAFGYCIKIPILTNSGYPEVIEDAVKYADVLYAHKINRRIISDLVGMSVDRAFSGYGPSLTDSLEVLCILAAKERRKWNLSENATMEVKIPYWAKEVFRADMSRRTGLALSDIATDQKIAAEFTARNFNVEYVADWQELDGEDVTLPGEFKMMVYPAGTFIKAVEPVVNLSAVYDAASLSINEYTGVFFEQGLLTAKQAYGSSLLTIPINTAGETGAALLQGLGDAIANGSF